MILWGGRKLFSQREKAVRLAIRHPLLAGRQPMGRGAYSMVFRGDDSVFKLTADRVAYALAECQLRWRCASLPRAKGLHGVVGMTDGGIPLFLLEIEILQKLAVVSEERRLCLSIARRIRQNSERCDTAAEKLRDAASWNTDASVRAALEHLADFAETWPARALLDMHGANFMQRPSTGEIVLSDPFLDAEIRRTAQKKFLMARGLPETSGFW